MGGAAARGGAGLTMPYQTQRIVTSIPIAILVTLRSTLEFCDCGFRTYPYSYDVAADDSLRAGASAVVAGSSWNAGVGAGSG